MGHLISVPVPVPLPRFNVNVASGSHGLRVVETPTERCNAIGEVTPAECKKFKADSKDFQDKITFAPVGEVDNFDVSYLGLPTGCQFYVDPANPSYNRFLYNAVDVGSDRDNDRGGANDANGWLSKSYSLRVCKEQTPLHFSRLNSLTDLTKLSDQTRKNAIVGTDPKKTKTSCECGLSGSDRDWYKKTCQGPAKCVWFCVSCSIMSMQDLDCCDL